MLRRILVANRGEIAVRIIRACHEMGIEAVAIYSEADAESMHVRLADRAVCVGPAPATHSYLHMQRILSAAVATECDGLHPGFGFLSENADFAHMCEEIGIRFIGPRSETIRQLGHKSTAKKMMAELGVPVIDGPEGTYNEVEPALEAAKQIGFPVIAKAASGGGGRGIRVIQNAEEFAGLFSQASQEALQAFGDPDMYIEKFLDHPRHVEFQILADNHGNCQVIGERDCSTQRRKQKILEESPCPVLTPEERTRMYGILSHALGAIGYRNAGTVEFLYQDNRFFFMEVNTRIQVEHPVTEMQTGLDLVREQIRIASDLPLSFDAAKLPTEGCSIEARINAEDPSRNFMPSAGKITHLRFPGGCGVRVDSALGGGDVIPPYYDSMVAKIIVHDSTRPRAIARLLRALSELEVQGISTNRDFVTQLLTAEPFVSAQLDILWVERSMQEGKLK